MKVEFIGEKSITVNTNQTLLDAGLQARVLQCHARGGVTSNYSIHLLRRPYGKTKSS